MNRFISAKEWRKMSVKDILSSIDIAIEVLRKKIDENDHASKDTVVMLAKALLDVYLGE